MKNSDICLSIRMIKTSEAGEPGSMKAALELIENLCPTRLEWSYVWKDEKAALELKKKVPVFVAALNTISPPGNAVSFDGEPVVAPWMKAFGTPDNRPTYMCQNNPQDVDARIQQAREIISKGIADTFQHDDWYCNAQMLDFGNPCFCGHCMREFSAYLGLGFDFDYRAYLMRRGISHTGQLLEAAPREAVPLWNDYRLFQQQTVSRYFRRLRAAMDRFLGRRTELSVNGSVVGFGGRVETILPFVSYFNGETSDFTTGGLKLLAEAARKYGVRQVVSFFPDVDAGDFHSPEFTARVKQAIGVCYCLGLLPLFPYDVYAGDKPRWYGTFDEYKEPYSVVRDHPQWFDDYQWTSFSRSAGDVIVVSAPLQGVGLNLEHTIGNDGTWQTQEKR